jgi:hypothetical protein
VIKSRGLRWAEHVECEIKYLRNSERILTGESENNCRVRELYAWIRK